jgi:DNA-binding NtrC family response regulator
MVHSKEKNLENMAGNRAFSLARRSDSWNAAMTTRKTAILIVEDDSAFAYAASRYLKDAGYDAVVCGGSMAAFKKMEESQINGVIVDVRLLKGEPHGLALARMIHDKDPAIPILLVTAYPELLKGEPSLPGPVFEKPVELASLAGALRKALSQ